MSEQDTVKTESGSLIRTFKKIIPYIKRQMPILTPMLILTLFIGLYDLLMPLFQKYALNHFVGENTLDTLPLFIALYLGLATASAFIKYKAVALCMEAEMSVDRDLRNDAFMHLQTLAFSYYNQNSVGYIHARMMSDVGHIGSLVSWMLHEGLWNIIYFFGAIVVMFVTNAKLALLVSTIVPILAVLYSVFQGKLLRLNREIRETNSKITGDFNEGISGAKTIKTLVVEDKISEELQKDTSTMRQKSMSAAKYHGLFAATMNLASSIAIALVLWRGGYIAKDEVGTFSMFMSYAEGLMEPLRWLIDIISSIITTQVNIERFTKLMETQSDVQDTPEVIEKYGDAFHAKRENWEPIKGDIRFDDVSFMYPDGDEYVLEHFNLDIPYGSNIAIVGETGAGKSTLVNLVCRFYEPTKGRILIDGRDARERSQLWLHSSIGYVLQSPHLFSGTIRENLLYGNLNATEEDMRRALRLVSADVVVDKLEKGLDSEVGEGGSSLSTGEKQLICFARAILADPKILILDEATASVDTITEQKVQHAIDTVIKGRTSLVIAHRLSTIKDADVILVVKDGKIIEQGKHKELLAKRGHYYELCTRQYEDEATNKALA